eukprot:GFUD01047167.1.p1 GENE.GFUD01047167.1~~GFUD01047167.1.p1  ORF type:complete len:134 (+),score=14.18 GFUD01047167.1:61-462(+)
MAKLVETPVGQQTIPFDPQFRSLTRTKRPRASGTRGEEQIWAKPPKFARSYGCHRGPSRSPGHPHIHPAGGSGGQPLVNFDNVAVNDQIQIFAHLVLKGLTDGQLCNMQLMLPYARWNFAHVNDDANLDTAAD